MNSDRGFDDENVQLVELAEQIMLVVSDKPCATRGGGTS
jgi:hypothetical protein